mgnify:CR=1 FL=1
MEKVRQIKLTLTTWQSEDDIEKVLQEMLWESHFTYNFDNIEWEINEVWVDEDEFAD